ncbi:uncharacterized protein [Haliotis cracherodii]|uniref:uncharacterized protein n=1 Tax=Haliotis cracherodii TaxID=6455 RepID=UPI0039EB0983
MRGRHRPFLLGLLTFLGTLTVSSARAVCRHKVQLMTFNADLSQLVPHYKQRKELIPLALAETNADVVCLQGIWKGSDVDHISTAVKGVFPHSFSNVHYTVGESESEVKKMVIWTWLEKYFPMLRAEPCKVMEAVPMGYCLLFSCQGLFGTELMKCMASNCARYMNEISAACIACIVRRPNNAKYEAECGEAVAFPGMSGRLNSHGLLMLSKLNITGTTMVRQQTGNHGFLKIEIQDVGSVICAHLHASDQLPAVEDCGEKDANPNRAYDNLMGVYNIMSSGDTKNHVIMGDLNTSPQLPWNITPLFGASYAALIYAGFSIPYVEHIGHCSYCADNKLVRSMGYNKSHILDHVLTKGFVPYSAKRTLESYRGEPLSAHYAVQVGICVDKK